MYYTYICADYLYNTTLVRLLYSTAIPTSFFNFKQLFFILVGNQLFTVTNECFKSYVQGINKLTRLFLARYKMESIYIQNLMKGQGSLELAMEILKKEDLQLTIFYKSDSRLLDGCYE